MTQEEQPESTVLEWYRRVIGEPDREIEVYLGFTAFFSAIAFAAVALVAVVIAEGFVQTRDLLFLLREVAIIIAMVALPLLFLGVIILLPVDRRGIVGGGIGTFICLVGIYQFQRLYPKNWNTVSATSQETLLVVGIYSLGISVVVASTAAALVAYQIARVRGPRPADIEPREEEDTGEDISAEEIERDIEQAMEDVDITWGGIERTNTTPLQLNTESVDNVDTSGMQVDVERISRDTVEDQVNGLKSLKAGEIPSQRSEGTVDDESAKLKELRERRAGESTSASSPAPVDNDEKLFSSLLRKLGLVK